ncbi:MAG: penicillin-binding protein activator [Marinibacterium sp.]|nr:penicillin-binding protein activator [Marinibacterium sp.]
MFAVFPKLRKPVLGLAAAAGLLALSACDTLPVGGTSGGPKIDTSAPVPVALLVPSGSGVGGDAVVARSLENAARLAIADLQGAKIDLRVYDTKGNAQVAAQEAERAVAEGAKIILGPVYAEAANAVGVAMADDNVNVLSFSNNPTIAGGNVFVLGPTFNNTADRLTRFAASQDKGRIVVVHADDVGGQLARNAMVEAITRTNGATLAGTVPYALSQQSVQASVPTIRNAVANSDADAIFLDATTSGALPLYTQLLPEAGVSPEDTQYIGLSRWDIPSQNLARAGVQGGWFTMPDPASSQQFSSRYQTAYGSAPHPIGGLAYDGISAIGSLVASGNSGALTGAALTQPSGFRGTGGIFRLLSNGTTQRALAVATVKDKRVVILDSAPTSFARAGS